jgi:hypothetical protein
MELLVVLAVGIRVIDGVFNLVTDVLDTFLNVVDALLDVTLVFFVTSSEPQT